MIRPIPRARRVRVADAEAMARVLRDAVAQHRPLATTRAALALAELQPPLSTPRDLPPLPRWPHRGVPRPRHAWSLALILLVSGCAALDDPFCSIARCEDACIAGVGCVESRTEAGVTHLFAADGELSLCGDALRSSSAAGADGDPCTACHGGER